MLLVTGATGFLGRRVVAALSGSGQEPVRALVHRDPGGNDVWGPGVELAQGDVTDPESLRRALRGVRAVVHLVATFRPRPGESFQGVNHQGTRSVVEAAREAGVQRVVHLGAIGAGPDPRREYGFSKWQGEQAVAASGLPYTILRPSILFGPGDIFLTTLAATARLFPVVPVAGSGRNRFQPLHVEDAARCVAAIAASDRYAGAVIEVGGPDQVTYDALLRLVAREMGLRRLLVHVPIPAMRLAARAMETTMPHPPVTREELGYLGLDSVALPDSVRRRFGFDPRPLEGNLGYLRRVGLREALAINLGRWPSGLRTRQGG